MTETGTQTASIERASIEQIIGTGDVRAVYQPIVELDSGRTVGYEALARGPRGTDLEMPNAMFAAAAKAGLITELDWLCRAAAVEGALRSNIGRSTRLFVNVEPTTFRRSGPAALEALFARAAGELDLVVEITERALVDDPSALIAGLAGVRRLGIRVAIDDVGADPASLALLPFVEPDVIKLDLRLVQQQADAGIAAIASAVRADAERRGATILAEGIETDEHRRRALVLGARLGQGWLYGRPAGLPLDVLECSLPAMSMTSESQPVPITPWSLVADSEGRRSTTRRLLLPMSRFIEQRAMDGDPSVVLSCFQDVRHYSAATMRRYEQLSARRSVVGAVGLGMARRPSAGVRGGTLPDGHPLAGEWTVSVVGPHEAVALIAREIGSTGPESEREFEYVITHDRRTVVAAARSLMQHIGTA